MSLAKANAGDLRGLLVSKCSNGTMVLAIILAVTLTIGCSDRVSSSCSASFCLRGSL